MRQWSFCAALALLSLCAAGCEANPKKPNIILILADDVGFGDLGCYGHPSSTSPNLDKMALEGLRFTDFYVASPLGSPSRAAFLTGRYPSRSGVNAVFTPKHLGGLPLNETTIPEILRSVGYKTAMIGKWQLGVGEHRKLLPPSHGFDYWMGVPYGNGECPCHTCQAPDGSCGQDRGSCSSEKLYVTTPLMRNYDIIEQPVDLFTISERYVQEATQFIKKQAVMEFPFFLHYSSQHFNEPQFAGRRFVNKSTRGRVGDALDELDWEVGEILQAVKEAGIDDNTFVFFTSDNGPSLAQKASGGNTGPLRCGKGTTWEGGMRVPAIARWPGKIKDGIKTPETTSTLDLFPTIINLVDGAKNHMSDATLDGVDISPVLFSSGANKREYFFYYPGNADPEHGAFAVRWNNYKAHFFLQGGYSPKDHIDEMCIPGQINEPSAPYLYDINQDPGEMHPLEHKGPHLAIIEMLHTAKKEHDIRMEWGPSQAAVGTSPGGQLCPQNQGGCSIPSWSGCCNEETLT